MKYMLWTVLGAAAVWLLLLWRSFRQLAKRNAAPAAAPVVPASTASAVVSPAATPTPTPAVPAAAPVAAATMAAPVAVATPATPATPATTLPPPRKQPFWRKWSGRLARTFGLTIALSMLLWTVLYVSSRSADFLGEVRAESVKSVGLPILYWTLGIIGVALAAWLIWRWSKGHSTPATSANPAAAAATGTAGTTTATPTAAEIKAAKDAAFREAVDKKKLSIQFWTMIRGWIWKTGLLAVSVWGIWFFCYRLHANGLTLSQLAVAEAGKSVPEPTISYTCITWPPGSLGTPPAQRAWVIQGQWGQRDHMWFNVECFVQGIPVVTLYRWDSRQKAGTWECEAKNERSTFTGDFDPTDPNRFSGEIEFEGKQYRYVLNRRITSQ